jgi:DNA-binding transcriptional ArsR family regulator
MAKVILPVFRSEDQQTADFFLALVNENRYRIIQFLRTVPQASVKKIAQGADVSLQRVSDYLGILRKELIVSKERSGREILYQLNQAYLVPFCLNFLHKLNITLDQYPEPQKAPSPPILLRIMKIFASEGRCSILRLLSQDTLSIHQIQEKVFMEQQTVSDHVQLLRQVHLIDTRQEGRFVFCQLNKANVATLFKMLLKDFQ